MVLKIDTSEEPDLVIGDVLYITVNAGIKVRATDKEKDLIEVDPWGEWEGLEILPGSIFKKLKLSTSGPVEIYYHIKEVVSAAS